MKQETKKPTIKELEDMLDGNIPPFKIEILPNGEIKCADINFTEYKAIIKELEDRRNADAELAGTNSCVDNPQLATLFLKHRRVAQELQNKYIK